MKQQQVDYSKEIKTYYILRMLCINTELANKVSHGYFKQIKTLIIRQSLDNSVQTAVSTVLLL